MEREHAQTIGECQWKVRVQRSEDGGEQKTARDPDDLWGTEPRACRECVRTTRSEQGTGQAACVGRPQRKSPGKQSGLN